MSYEKKPLLRARTLVQIFFFVLVALITLNKVLVEAGLQIPFLSEASLHAICPFGGVVSIYKFATVGTFVQKIHESAFILMAAAFLLTLAFGPVICGWVCPLGSFQEWTTRLARRITGKKILFHIPEKIDKYLRFTRYIVLFLVVYATATSAKLVFQDVDPYFALFNFWSEEVSWMALTILGITILLSLFIERPWCKYACPYGAVLGIFNLLRIFKIKRASSTCINCKACERACPMNIQVTAGTTVTDHQCISCLACTSENACPVPNTVEFSKARHLALFIPIIIFGSVLITSYVGIWQTTTDKVPATYKEGEFTGKYNPADIRGSYTFADIAKSFQIPLEDLGIAFGIKEPAAYAAFQVKQLETLYADLAAEGTGIGTGSVRYFVALYKGLPYTVTEATSLPQTAVDILKAKADLTVEQINSLEKYAVKIP